MTTKRTDMTKTQLAAQASATNLPGRSKMNGPSLAEALNAQERTARVARFGQEDESKLTPKQSRRVQQKMNRQK